MQYDFGMIGLGTMGRNFLLNVADKGFSAAGLDLDPEKAASLNDKVIEGLLPHLDQGDLIIDGGNSHYNDTARRAENLNAKGIRFLGVGVSGGEEGARRGPSIMPGGDFSAWEDVQPILEAVSAKVDREPCVAYMGKGAAGRHRTGAHLGGQTAYHVGRARHGHAPGRWVLSA